MRPDRRMPTQDAIEILKCEKLGVLSTSSIDGVPYAIPLNYFFVPEENAIYFHCAKVGRKLANIAENNKVSFVVIGNEKIMEDRFTTHYESVIVAGTASLITDDDEKRNILVQLCKALAPNAIERREMVIEKYFPAVTIVKIEISEITGKKNQDA